MLKYEKSTTQDDGLRSILEMKIAQAVARFPKHFDNRLYKGLERLAVNSPRDFLSSRSMHHLQSLLVVQFSLQKNIESALQQETGLQNPLFLKLFSRPSRICIALSTHDSNRFRREQLLKTVQILLPGIQEIPRSFFMWHQPELPYLFCYMEVQKMRGEELSVRELKKLEIALKDQLQAIPPATPALFWPYNEEESYRQVQILLKEVLDEKHPPHVSIQFQEQTPTSLEFLVHIARPKATESLSNTLESLPRYLDFFCHFEHTSKQPFPIEVGAFALKVPSHAFNVRDSINLLYARRYVLKYLETTLGPCRDYNGGLFEKQQQHFENCRVLLGDKIPLFDLFAEKIFYALHPIERRLILSMKEAEDLFMTFSKLMQVKEDHANRYKDNVIIFKAANSADLQKLSSISKHSKQIDCRAHVNYGGFHYLCLMGPGAKEIQSEIAGDDGRKTSTKTLHLIFEEGKPTSLNPYHSAGDMRCRLLCKHLFEGLTRLNDQGIPELAGAASCQISDDGLIYQFKLRPNRWSNGERVAAIDYAASLKRGLKSHISHPEIHYVIKNGENFKKKKVPLKELGIRAIDADTLEIELEYPDPNFLYLLSQPYFFPLFGIMQEPKWFNGPYLLREQHKDGILLQRNPYYWNAKQLYFDEIELKWMKQIDSIYHTFQQGKLDWIGDPLSTLSTDLIDQIEMTEPLGKQEVCRHFLIIFNLKHPVLRSPLIRRALSLAIDREEICRNIYPYSYPSHLTKPLKEEANALFEEGLREFGISRSEFPVLTFSFSDQTRREQLARCLQSVWQETLGIQIKLEQIEWNTFRSRLEKGAFDICATIQNIQDNPTPNFLERFEGVNSWNFAKWENLHYRKIVANAKLEKDDRKCFDLIAEAQTLLYQEAPFTSLFKYMHLYAHTPQLQGYRFDSEGCIDFSHSYFYEEDISHVEK